MRTNSSYETNGHSFSKVADHFSGLVENIDGIFWVRDLRTSDIQYVSPSYERMFSRPIEAFYNDPFDYLQLVLPEDRHVITNALDAIDVISGKAKYEYRIMKSGEIRWLQSILKADNHMLYGFAHDVTELKQSQIDLREKSNMFESIFNNNLYGIAATNHRYRLTAVNPAFCEMLGYTKKELLTMGMPDVTVPDDVGKSKELIDKLAAREIKEFIVEKKYITKSGEIVHALTAVRANYDEDGTMIENVATIKDLTEAKKTADNLQKLLNVFEENNLGIAINSGASDQIEAMNPAFAKMHGYEPEEIIGHPIPDFYLPVEKWKFQEALKQADKLGFHDFECTRVKKDGSQFHAHVQVSSIKNPDGDSSYYIGQVRDITEDINARQALHDSEAQIKTIFKSAPDAVIMIDDQGRIEKWNAKAEILFGWKEEEVVGRSLHETIIPKKHRNAHMAGMKNYHLKGSKESSVINKTVELTAVNRKGKNFHVSLSVSETIVNNKTYFIGFVSDITHRKRSEEILKNTVVDLRRANQELKSFAHIISHDLKAPLRAIGTLSDFLILDHADHLDKNGKDQLNLLKNRVNRMDSLINGILEYSKISLNDESYVKIDINKTIKQVIDLLGPDKNVQIKIDNKLPVVIGQPTQIQQVFLNLINNAIQHIEKDKAVINIGSEEDHHYWQFYVKDNGPGIEERHHERIFEIFQTLKSKDKHETRGIGLSIVGKIIEMHHGKIWVESRMRKGTTFHFSIAKEKVDLEKEMQVS